MPDIEQLLRQLIQSGKVPPALMETLTEAQNDPSKLGPLLEKLTALVGPSAPAPLNIEDYYQERDGRKFELRWPLSQGNPLLARAIPFTALDRKTQFFTLFAEWSRRETDGLMLMNGGDLAGAEAVFREGIERARQIDVPELAARSYENLARVAERRSDQASVRSHLEAAERARSAA
jgi:hypothetical protein